MQFITLTIILAVCTMRFLTQGNQAMRSDGWLPNVLSFTPEILSLLVLLFVVVAGTRSRFQYVRPAYWFVFGALSFCMVCGVIVNAVDAGPIFAGLRQYLRAIPLFFLPAIFAFSNRQIRAQLLLLLGIALTQIPLSVYQRFLTLGLGDDTGDWTSGTLMISSIMSLFQISAACVLTAFYMRKRIGLWKYLALTIAILIPTMVNETKATLIILPLSLLTVFLMGSSPGVRIKNLVVSLVFLAVFVPSFVVVYDSFLIGEGENAIPISEFFFEKGIEKHVYKGDDLNPDRMIGRFDAVVVPVEIVAKDLPTFVFGLGMGNVSESGIAPGFTGKYFDLWGIFAIHTVGLVILELGMAGLLLLGLVYWLIFQDSLVVARSEGLRGTLALAWIGVMVTISLGSLYKTLIYFESLSYLFWYFSGLIAAERMRLAHQTSRTMERARTNTGHPIPEGAATS